jgi:hypothetical protein
MSGRSSDRRGNGTAPRDRPHYDADYDLIAEITGQPTQWVVPRGTVP